MNVKPVSEYFSQRNVATWALVWIGGYPNIPKTIEACLLDILVFGKKHFKRVGEGPHVFQDVPVQRGAFLCSPQVLRDGQWQSTHPPRLRMSSCATMVVTM
jgi:hypothetical protein